MLEESYRYCPNDPMVPGSTSCRLDNVTMGYAITQPAKTHIIIEPSGMVDKHTYLAVGPDMDVVLDEEELDQLIANLQRARSGCFYDKFPRPPEEGPTMTVREFVHAVQTIFPDDAVVHCPDRSLRISMPA